MAIPSRWLMVSTRLRRTQRCINRPAATVTAMALNSAGALPSA